MGNHEEFTEYATAAATRLRNVAYLMCHDWHQAQDLTQITLAKVFVNWSRIRRRDNVDVYARQILVREFLNGKRRFSSTERPTADVPELADRSDSADLRLTLLQALGSLSPNQRAVVVLRYWEDQSVEQVAALMRTTPGAVKSLAFRGLRELRVLLGGDFPIEAGV
ncbi:RNA polymerase sigma-70 factor (sigma-E family) [Catenulispora sp. GAS73]|uniref:SigE family RNA polymerase sigma factor n=1 Tax=Catenulispora sp. GAS73 TaxID=3156269 RepID=UPI0035190E22